MTAVNLGPANAQTPNTQSALTSLQPVIATLGSGPYDDLGMPTLPGYLSGGTGILMLTPASGNTTINSLKAENCPNNFTVLIINQSATDNLIFTHLTGPGYARNRFSNSTGQSIYLAPLAAARVTYINDPLAKIQNWQFA